MTAGHGPTLSERIAALEERVEAARRQQERTAEVVEELRRSIEDLRAFRDRGLGVLAAIVFVFSLLGAAIKSLIDRAIS